MGVGSRTGCGVKHILSVNEKLIREGYNECNKDE